MTLPNDPCPRPTRWLPAIKSEAGPAVRLFCFPHAGGGAALFHRWATHIAPEVELLPVKLPGREERFSDAPYRQLEPLVEAAAKALGPHLSRPFALFGHSMGALIAFEIARHIRQTLGKSPSFLFVAACRAPHLPPIDEPLANLPEGEFLDLLQDRYGALDDALLRNPPLMQLLLPTLRADITLVESYRYRDHAPLDCPVLALGGSDDKAVSAADLAAWREHTTGPFSQRMFPGGHFFLESSRDGVVRTVCQRLLPLIRK